MNFDEWLSVQLGPTLRLATVLSGSPDVAEDLVQDVLVRAHARWTRIGTLENPNAYVRRMLVNEHLSWRRRLARSLRRDTAGAASPGERAPFDQQWVDREELLAEIGRLPRRQQTVVVLRYLEELSVEETADLMGCGPSTVRGYAARALATLRIELTESAARADGLGEAKEDRHAH